MWINNVKEELFMKKLIIVLAILGVIGIFGAAVASWGVGKYNNLIALGQNIDKSWGQIENVLQRRNDLIPNLVNVVQAYAIQEQEVFIKVAEARNVWAKAMQAGTTTEKIKADGVMSGALLNLMAVAERYPDLKSNQNFLALQDELAGTENRIAVERMRYNESVQLYNTTSKSFPTNLIAGIFKFPAERDYFKAEEGAAKAPEVRITYPGVPVPGVTPPPPPKADQPPTGASTGPTVPQAIPAPAITPPAQTEPAAPAPAPAVPAAPAPTK